MKSEDLPYHITNISSDTAATLSPGLMNGSTAPRRLKRPWTSHLVIPTDGKLEQPTKTSAMISLDDFSLRSKALCSYLFITPCRVDCTFQ